VKVICLINMGTVDECLVVNDGDEAKVIAELADANDAMPADDRIHIRALSPTSVEAALEYIKQI
jgi:hypothetical protein